MAIKNCKECGKIFSHPSSVICQDCKLEDERDFEKVRDYLTENKNAGIQEVSDRTGVSVNNITRYLRSGRLLAQGIHSALNVICEGCGVSIEAGHYCEGCQKRLFHDLKGKKKKDEEKPEVKKGKKADKMFVYDRIKKRQK